jgi:hypothetical protein
VKARKNKASALREEATKKKLESLDSSPATGSTVGLFSLSSPHRYFSLFHLSAARQEL